MIKVKEVRFVKEVMACDVSPVAMFLIIFAISTWHSNFLGRFFWGVAKNIVDNSRHEPIGFGDEKNHSLAT